MQLTKDKLLSMYRRMVTIRIFEQSLPHLYEEGYLVGTGHASMGEEAVAVAACAALDEKDYIMSTHRAHGHILAKGANMPIILAELFGKATGCTGGKGGSMHISDFDRNFLGTSNVLSPVQADRSIELVLRLENLKEVSELMEIVNFPG